MPLAGVNYRQPTLNMPKIMVHCYSTDEIINQSAIGYMINPSLNCNNVFIVQVEKLWSVSFDSITMEAIIDFLKKKNTCVMALIMIYENNLGNVKKCIEY